MRLRVPTLGPSPWKIFTTKVTYRSKLLVVPTHRGRVEQYSIVQHKGDTVSRNPRSSYRVPGTVYCVRDSTGGRHVETSDPVLNRVFTFLLTVDSEHGGDKG